MTNTRIEHLPFVRGEVASWAAEDPRRRNWPVVYTLENQRDIYVGETLNAEARFRQHLESPTKQGLERIQVIFDETFNKSACLDLESHLIRLFAGDGKYRVLNANAGVTDADYYERPLYRERFAELFTELWDSGYFTKSQAAIENSDLFKLSPFKSLTQDQAIAVESIVEGLFTDLADGVSSTSVVRGDPGTGKTIVGIFLLKLLTDIRDATSDASVDDSLFADFFADGHRELLSGFRMGIVVPQQSLRESISNVFKHTPGLSPDLVLTPFDVADSAEDFDLLIVDEAHRLTQYGAQAMGTITKRFREISQRLFGVDYESRTQLDWIQARSRHQIFLLDPDQRVRPIDAPAAAFKPLLASAHVYPLATQMRVKAGSDYVGFIRDVLHQRDAALPDLGDYELALYDDFDAMYDRIRSLDHEHGLSRLLSGYAWKWTSRGNRDGTDIHLGSHSLAWNRKVTDWVNSPGSLSEVGSIHTIQGYDLNYAGVIIGNDLRLDPTTGKIVFDRSSYFDQRGKANNKLLGMTYTDDDLLELVRNIYSVLLTRGIRGTFVYVCDPPLREYLSRFVPLRRPAS